MASFLCTLSVFYVVFVLAFNYTRRCGAPGQQLNHKQYRKRGGGGEWLEDG